MRYELADCEWAAIKPTLPNKRSTRVIRLWLRLYESVLA